MAAQFNRSRILGALGSVAAHLAFVAIVLWSVKTPGPPPEPRPMRVALVPWASLQTQPRGRATHKPPLIPPPTAPARPAAENIRAPLRPATEPAPTSPVDESSGNAAVRAVLRAALGCSHEGLLHLSAAEQARCADRLAHQPDPGVSWAVPTSAAKRAVYDADIQARRLARRPDLLGCVLPFDGSGFKPVSGPGYGTKLGPLPCYTGDGRALKSQDIRKGESGSDWPP